MAAAEGGARSPWQRERLLFVWEPAAALAPVGRPAHAAAGARRRLAPPAGHPAQSAPLPLPGCPLGPAGEAPQTGCPAAREPPRAEGSTLGQGLVDSPSAGTGYPCLAHQEGCGLVT